MIRVAGWLVLITWSVSLLMAEQLSQYSLLKWIYYNGATIGLIGGAEAAYNSRTQIIIYIPADKPSLYFAFSNLHSKAKNALNRIDSSSGPRNCIY